MSNSGQAGPRPGLEDATNQRPNDRYDLRILVSIRQIIRAVAVGSRQLAAKRQITGPQLMCLIAVVEEGSATATGIAKQVHLSASTVVGILDRLESKGLVRRQRGRQDRRVVHISATDVGRQVVASTPFPLQHAVNATLREFPEPEQARIAGWLERLVDVMVRQEVGTGPVVQIGAAQQTVNSDRDTHDPGD